MWNDDRIAHELKCFSPYFLIPLTQYIKEITYRKHILQPKKVIQPSLESQSWLGMSGAFFRWTDIMFVAKFCPNLNNGIYTIFKKPLVIDNQQFFYT